MVFLISRLPAPMFAGERRTPPLHKKSNTVEKASGQPAKLAACFFVCRIWMNPVEFVRCRGPPLILIFAHPKKSESIGGQALWLKRITEKDL